MDIFFLGKLPLGMHNTQQSESINAVLHRYFNRNRFSMTYYLTKTCVLQEHAKISRLMIPGLRSRHYIEERIVTLLISLLLIHTYQLFLCGYRIKEFQTTLL